MKIFTSFLFIITFLVSCGDQDQSNETFSSDQGLSQEHKKEFKKVQWTEIDNVTGSKSEDKSQAIIQ